MTDISQTWFLVAAYFEFIFIIFVLILIISCASLCLRIRIFHENLIGLVFILFSEAIISMILRAAIVFHSFFDPGFCYDEIKIWESPYKLVDFGCYSFRIGLFCLFGYIIFERFIACYRIKTYEKTRNLSILFGGVIYSLLIGIICAYLIIYLKINILYLVGIAEAGNLNGVFMIALINWWNVKRYKKTKWDSSYSLSMRFQLSENVRTSLCLKRSYTLVFCCNFFTFLTYGASFYMNDPLTNQLARACFNYALLAYSIGLIIIIIYTIPVYKYKALGYFQKVSNFFKRNRIIPEKHSASKRPNLNHVRSLEGRKIVFELAKEGELYFSQLNDSWN